MFTYKYIQYICQDINIHVFPLHTIFASLPHTPYTSPLTKGRLEEIAVLALRHVLLQLCKDVRKCK